MEELCLSEAIRSGAKIRPQAYYNYFEAVPTNSREFQKYRDFGFLPKSLSTCRLGSCVMGAAYEGAFAEVKKIYDGAKDELEERFPELKRMMKDIGKFWPSPCGCNIEFFFSYADLHDFAVHLNAQHKWKREKIADFLQSKGY